MTETIGVQPWMSEPATLAVIAALEARGGPGCARFVGGCVRDTVMGLAVGDIDIATPLKPGTVEKALAEAGLRAVPTGIEHGTVTAISGGKPYEITTLRRDVSTDGRRATVAFTDDWLEDAQRRDFRFNALYADSSGAVFDPTGRGIEDARLGRVVFIGDAANRLREDYLRILRYFRFLSWYGAADPDRDALAACQAMKAHLAGLSAERVAKELLKLLAAPDPRSAARLMAQTGVLAEVLPEAHDLRRFEGLVGLETDSFFDPDAELRLAALFRDAAAARTAGKRLRLSNAQQDRLIAAVAGAPVVQSWMSPKAARRAVYQAGAGVFADRVTLAWAAAERTAAVPQWRALLALGQAWTPPTLPVRGDDAIALGVPMGPMVGQALGEVEAWWVDHDFPDDRAAAIEQLKAIAQGMAY